MVAHDPRRAELQRRRHQDDMLDPWLLLLPEANHTGGEGHVTLWPPMLHAAHPGPGRLSPGGMCVPRVCQCGQCQGRLRRPHVRFERDDDSALPCAFQRRERGPIEQTTSFAEPSARAPHWCRLQQGTTPAPYRVPGGRTGLRTSGGRRCRVASVMWPAWSRARTSPHHFSPPRCTPTSRSLRPPPRASYPEYAAVVPAPGAPTAPARRQHAGCTSRRTVPRPAALAPRLPLPPRPA